MRSVYDGIKVVSAVDPNPQANGTPLAAFVHVVDTFGYNSALFNVQTGTATGTTVAFTVDAKVQEATASNGTFSDVSGATITQLSATGTTTGKSAQVRVEGLGTSRSRYLKLVITVASLPADKVVHTSAQCLLGRAYKNPVGNSGTPTSGS